MLDNKLEEDEMAQFYMRRGPKVNPDGRVVAPALQKKDKQKKEDKLVAAVAVPTPNEGNADVNVAPTSTNMAVKADRAVCGFLFSVSRNGQLEYWVLHEGTNNIGRLAGSDVLLDEATVENTHAKVDITHTPNGLKAMLTDLNSVNGTLVNGMRLGSEPRECYDRDTLTVGSCYELLLVLADAQKYGLAAKANFIDPGEDAPVTSEKEEEDEGTVFGSVDTFDADDTRIV